MLLLVANVIVNTSMQDEARELKRATCDGNVQKVEKMININEDGIDINSAIWVSINSGCVKVATVL